MIFDLVVIGGGAAGFYGAIQAAYCRPDQNIIILEKSSKVLSKVRVSGGGRCNVTHNCLNPFELAHHYPRGEKILKTMFKSYHAGNVVAWFNEKGVELKSEEDGRMFPVTNSSETIIQCFLKETSRMNIRIDLNKSVISVKKIEGTFTTEISTGEKFYSRKVLIAIGGNPNAQAYSWISSIGHTVATPIPSLFTFNDKEKRFIDLMGIAVQQAEVRIAGTKYYQNGPVLITHWGLSGPAIIKLSAWAAEYLYKTQYTFDVIINWIGLNEDACRSQFIELKRTGDSHKIETNPQFNIPFRLWQKLCVLADVLPNRTWAEVSHREVNRLVENLVHSVFHIGGKTTFKEEFVTCGGVDLNDINTKSMESTLVKGLYFAGEVVNIDGETGGFNFQSAWTTAYLAARSISLES